MTDQQIYEAMAILNCQNKAEKVIFELLKECLKLCENDRIEVSIWLQEWLEK